MKKNLANNSDDSEVHIHKDRQDSKTTSSYSEVLKICRFVKISRLISYYERNRSQDISSY
jgi:hypothetical protein